MQFVVHSSRPVVIAGSGGKEGPHAKPNPSVLLSHVAVKALVDLRASEVCLEAVNSDLSSGALWALRLMHDPGVVQGLMDRYSGASTNGAREGS